MEFASDDDIIKNENNVSCWLSYFDLIPPEGEIKYYERTTRQCVCHICRVSVIKTVFASDRFESEAICIIQNRLKTCS